MRRARVGCIRYLGFLLMIITVVAACGMLPEIAACGTHSNDTPGLDVNKEGGEGRQYTARHRLRRGLREFKRFRHRGHASHGSTLYRTRGNGFIIDIRHKAYQWYEVTSKSLLPMAEGRIIDDTIYHNGCAVQPLDYLLAMSDEIPRLPEAEVTEASDDPIDNFEVFWSTFNEYYALFDLVKDVDWQAEYDAIRPRITPTTTADELWAAFSEMIAPLNDGHTMLLDFAGGRAAYSRPLQSSPSSWMMENLEAYAMTIGSYLDSFSPEVNIAGNGSILYGTIGQRIGYLNILAFEGFTATPPESDGLSILDMMCGYGRDMEVFPEMIDNIFDAFAGMDALIVDLRFNAGGSGDLVMELTDRLVAQKQPAYVYQIRTGGYSDFDPPVLVHAEPRGVQFLGRPIIVLTSNNTVSAGDLQAMLLKNLPNATLIGETTFGIFSEGIPRTLPNGWQFTLSTQRLSSPDGESYEQKGITPHMAVTPDADQLQQGHDNMLEAALSYLENAQ